MNEVPDKLEPFDPSSITNREWLWLEDTCGVDVTKLKPMRLLMAFKTVALRRWEAAEGRPPKITFSDVVDGAYNHVELKTVEQAAAAGNPTGDGQSE